ncbi:hypothetical protein [Flavobacterium phycosphaerae]|uniref:hypothetical protein n=1 Tax=Flavobacterium phycosphaerae TaxID=2697515 RepID=UPI00138A29AB|nr:hypothetical protein [Flavobacterium phycosphaerae]
MRIVAFIGYLCLLLCGGSHNFYADTQPSTTYICSPQQLSEDRQLKFTIDDSFSIVIEDTDIDIEEEHLSSDEAKKGNDSNFFVGKYGLYKNGLTTFTTYVHLNYYNNEFASPHFFSDNSAPIYIKNRTLRI